jgi:hypothetical protein
MKKNEAKSTATITNVYVTNSLATQNTQLNHQGSISLSNQNGGFDRAEYETAIRKASRKTSAPAARMK